MQDIAETMHNDYSVYYSYCNAFLELHSRNNSHGSRERAARAFA